VAFCPQKFSYGMAWDQTQIAAYIGSILISIKESTAEAREVKIS